jgi:signal transduction histidine kinase
MFASLCAAIMAAVVLALALHGSSLQVSNPALRGAMEAVAGVAALVVTWLAVLRAARTQRAADVALASGLGLIVLNSTLLVTLTGLDLGTGQALAWLAVPGRLVGAALLLAAGLGSLEHRPHAASPLTLGTAIGLAALGLAVLGAGLGVLRDSTTVTALPQVASIALLVAAAVALAARARRVGEVELWWYSGAIVALAATRALFWLLPPKGPEWVSPGDLARLLVAAALLMVLRFEFQEHRRRARAKTLELERQRLAREFHDGLAQELAFIVNQSRRALAGKSDAEGLEMLAAAGQTALVEARQAIFKLNRPSSTMLSTAIVEHTMRIADRAGLTLDVEVDGEVPLDREAEHEVLRIVGEAVSNAGKHANASRVSVSISSQEGRVIVRIADDGDGFDVAARRRRRGFGLVSMSERTRSLGGRLHLESTPGEGTVIEVAI